MSWIGLAALIVLFEDTSGWSKRRKNFFRSLLALFGFCGPYAAIMFPLFAFSYFVYRERERVVQTAILAGCSLLQFGIFVLVRHSGGAASRLETLTLDSAIVNVFYFHVAGALGGKRGAIANFRNSDWRMPFTNPSQCQERTGCGGRLFQRPGRHRWCSMALSGMRSCGHRRLLIGTVASCHVLQHPRRFRRSTDPVAFFPGLAFLLVVLDAAWNHRYLAAKALCSILLLCALWSGIRDYRRFWITYDAGAPVWSDEVQKWRLDNSYQLRVWPSFFPPVVAWDSKAQSKRK